MHFDCPFNNLPVFPAKTVEQSYVGSASKIWLASTELGGIMRFSKQHARLHVVQLAIHLLALCL